MMLSQALVFDSGDTLLDGNTVSVGDVPLQSRTV
jgi:hypothetical protein